MRIGDRDVTSIAAVGIGMIMGVRPEALLETQSLLVQTQIQYLLMIGVTKIAANTILEGLRIIRSPRIAAIPKIMIEIDADKLVKEAIGEGLVETVKMIGDVRGAVMKIGTETEGDDLAPLIALHEDPVRAPGLMTM